MNLKDSIEILRPINCLMGALTILIGLLNTRAGIPFNTLLTNIILGVLTYFFLAGAGMVINDYYDYEIDKINRPQRPIPRGSITLNQAKLLYVIYISLGIALSIFNVLIFHLSFFIIIIAVIFGLIGLIYAKWGKRSGFLGNIIVSVSFSIGMIYGALLNRPYVPIYIISFFLTSFFLLLSREVIKGCEDIEGDKKESVKTLAIRIGIKNSTNFAIFFASIAIAFYVFSFFSNLINPFLYFIFMILGILIVASSIFLMIRSNLDKKDFGIISLLLKIGAFLGLLTFLIASI
jgi:geranylgeranylglycerol-phosphate geranylgeranyltransferase